VPQQVHDAGLDLGVREHGQDRFGESLEAVDHGKQHVLDTPIA